MLCLRLQQKYCSILPGCIREIFTVADYELLKTVMRTCESKLHFKYQSVSSFIIRFLSWHFWRIFIEDSFSKVFCCSNQFLHAIKSHSSYVSNRNLSLHHYKLVLILSNCNGMNTTQIPYKNTFCSGTVNVHTLNRMHLKL